LLVPAFAISTAGKANDNIIIGNADTVRETTPGVEQGLVDAIAGAGRRVVAEYANTLRHIELLTLPGALQTKLDQASARVVTDQANTIRHSDLPALPASLQTVLGQVSRRVAVEYANNIRHEKLLPLSTALQTLLGQVSDRIVFQYANTNRELRLSYPGTLVNDTTPPQVTQIAVNMMGEDSAIVTWTTDEFADSTVKCGTQSGNYTMTFSDPLYVKQHTLTLTGLAAGTTFYCVCRSADLSGNTYQSQEFHFEQTEEIFVYLPLVLRSR